MSGSHFEWKKEESGWYTHLKYGGICRESDGWYIYPMYYDSDIGIGPYQTLKIAKQKTEKRYFDNQALHNE